MAPEIASLDSRRLEELSLNSSAPPGQLVYDGWLLRLLAGKAKRARSVNAIYASKLPLEEKIAYCERLYATAGLPLLFRITPFSEPSNLDSELARRGYTVLEPTSVESAPLARDGFPDDGTRECGLEEWIDAVAELRGSPLQHRDAHRARLEGLPLPKCALLAEEEGRIVAAGLTIVEGSSAGLFDIETLPAERRRGHGRRIVAGLLNRAFALGARHAYLQVTSNNAPARKLYAQFGFTERYQYWYRQPT